MKKFIPNFLTSIRLFLVPVFIYFVFISQIESTILWASVIFLFASITDYFDGMLARKFDVVSNYGKIMDPLADKLLVISALFALSLKLNIISNWLVYIISIREIAVSCFREYFAYKKIFITANLWGKIKTFMQMIGIIIILLYLSIIHLYHIDTVNSVVRYSFEIYFWIVALITWVSGLQYFIIILKMRR